jgi:hypothetical protein
MIAVKYALILSLAFSASLVVASKSRAVRIVSAKWSFDFLAILILGAVGNASSPAMYAFALTLVGVGALFSFMWMMLKNEGFRDHDKL